VKSIILVTLQLAAMAAIIVPWDSARWNGVATLVVAAGVALGVWALTANRLGNFNIRPEPKAGGYLATGGPYAYVRHPMYLAVLLITFGFCIGYATPWRWIVFVALAVVLDRKTRIEEAELARLHPGYPDYAQRTKRIVPYLW
jgi:protein-S-isoprenylcysteine O-methyltransferase Ste14